MCFLASKHRFVNDSIFLLHGNHFSCSVSLILSSIGRNTIWKERLSKTTRLSNLSYLTNQTYQPQRLWWQWFLVNILDGNTPYFWLKSEKLELNFKKDTMLFRYFWAMISFFIYFFLWTLLSFILYFWLNEKTIDFGSLGELGFSSLLLCLFSCTATIKKLLYPLIWQLFYSKQGDFVWQEVWRTSIHLFKVRWNSHLVNYFSLGINTNLLPLTFSRALF